MCKLLDRNKFHISTFKFHLTNTYLFLCYDFIKGVEYTSLNERDMVSPCLELRLRREKVSQ